MERRIFPVFEPMASLPPADLLWSQNAEKVRSFAVDLPAVRIVHYERARYGGSGFLARDGRQLFDPETMRHYLKSLWQGAEGGSDHGLHSRGTLIESASRNLALETPALVPLHSNMVYGHFLLEMLPNALLLDQVMPPDYPLLVPDTSPRWIDDILALALANRRRLFFRSAEQSVVAPSFVNSSLMFNKSGIRPEVVTLFALMKARIAESLGWISEHHLFRCKRIFLYRKSISRLGRFVVN